MAEIKSNEAGFDPFAKFTMDELGAMYDRADDNGFSNGFSQGRISSEISRRSALLTQPEIHPQDQDIVKPTKSPVKPKTNWHPLDGSFFAPSPRRGNTKR